MERRRLFRMLMRLELMGTLLLIYPQRRVSSLGISVLPPSKPVSTFTSITSFPVTVISFACGSGADDQNVLRPIDLPRY
jgi:hypothetical protein